MLHRPMPSDQSLAVPVPTSLEIRDEVCPARMGVHCLAMGMRRQLM